MAQEFGIARETVRKMLRYSVPPGDRRERPVKRPKLGLANRVWHLRSTRPTRGDGIDHMVGGQSGRSEPPVQYEGLTALMSALPVEVSLVPVHYCMYNAP